MPPVRYKGKALIVQGQSPDHGLRVVWKSWGLPLTSYSSPLSPFSVYHPTPPELRAGGWAKSWGTEPTEPPYFKPCPLKMKAILRSGFNYLIFGAHCCLLVIYLCRFSASEVTTIWRYTNVYIIIIIIIIMQKTHLGGKANLLESCFGNWITHVWGAVCGSWGFSPCSRLIVCTQLYYTAIVHTSWTSM